MRLSSPRQWEPLTASRYPQHSHEAVAGQRVDPCDVGWCEPTNETDHGLELIESSPAPVAYLEVPFEALSLAFVQLAVEVLGHLVDQVDAGKIVGTRLPRVRQRSLFLRSGAPDEREPGFGPDGAWPTPPRDRGSRPRVLHPASGLRRRAGGSPVSDLPASPRGPSGPAPARQGHRPQRRGPPRPRVASPSDPAIRDDPAEGSDREGRPVPPQPRAWERAATGSAQRLPGRSLRSC